MMKNFNKIVGIAMVLAIVISSCSHYDEIQKNPKESKANDDESHNTGNDCMSCHNKSGSEAASEGYWNVAGTVFFNNNPLNNATIELWSEPNGGGYKIYTLTSDKKGNFYTNKIIDFKGGCYPVAKKGNITKYMNSKFLGKISCNNSGCHGGAAGTINFN
jgi:hypothetical protein